MRIAPGLLILTPILALAQSLPPTPKLTGAPNFRDIGGLRTSDGRVVRKGLIFRSGELNRLTEADLQALAPFRIRYIYDLRTNAERASAPTK